MRVKLVLAALLLILPCNICCSKEDQKSNLETQNLIKNDVSDGKFIVIDDKTSGPAVKTVARREAEELNDKNDYAETPLCGDKQMQYGFRCYCGNRTLSGKTDLRDGDYYCCEPTNDEEQCKFTEPGPGYGWSSVRCENGEVKHKTEPCRGNCWNPYTRSKRLYKKATLYCQEEDYCLPLDQMCSGVCREESELCDPETLRCLGEGYTPITIYGYPFADDYTEKSLPTKLGKLHGYCLKINNDQVYDSLSRNDEVKVIGTHQSTVNYTGLIKCQEPVYQWYVKNQSTDGILCSGYCKTNKYWCAGTDDVCQTNGNDDEDMLSLDHPELCRNATYWRSNNFSCNQYSNTGLVTAVGARCSGNLQQCIFPWYRNWIAETGNNPTCEDKSDQVFPINSSCSQFNKLFVETYKTNWCSGDTDRERGDYCEGEYNLREYDDLDDWFSQQDSKITDPHGCQRSCSTDGPDCLTCEHPDFFKCNATGFCIHKDLVCDHHPHPSCGGDDEGIDLCLKFYFKKRIVKPYATLICPSKMYPGNNGSNFCNYLTKIFF